MRILSCIFWICVLLSVSACVTIDQTRGTPQEIASINIKLAKSYYSKGMFDVAEQKLQTALGAQDDSVAANMMLALVYQQQGKNDQAGEQFEKTLDLTSQNSVEFAETSNDYAVFLCENGNWKAAEAHFLDAVNVVAYKTKGAAYENAGFCAINAKDYKKAGLYFSEALKQNSAMARSMLGLARVKIHRKDWLSAKILLVRFQKTTAATDESLYLLSRVELELGDKAQAAEYVKQLKASFPGSTYLEKLN